MFSRHKVEHLKSTDHPEHPTRILLICRDASVRIQSPASGDIITTLMGDQRMKLVDAAYAIEDSKFRNIVIKEDMCTSRV